MRVGSLIRVPLFATGIVLVVMALLGGASASSHDACQTQILAQWDGTYTANCVPLNCVGNGCIFVNPNPGIFLPGTWTCSCGPMTTQNICNLYFYTDSLGQLRMNCFNPMICPSPTECYIDSIPSPPPAPLGQLTISCECR